MPILDMNVLEESLKILANLPEGKEFPTKASITNEARCWKEWRSGRDARGRAAQAYWEALFEVYMPIAHRLERKMLFETPRGHF